MRPVIISGKPRSFIVAAASILCGMLFMPLSAAALSYIMFQHHYGSGRTEAARGGVTRTTDLGFVMAGESNSNRNDFDVYIVKTDFSGLLQWAFQYNIGGDDFAYDIQQTSDGGFIVTGKTHAPTVPPPPLGNPACMYNNEMFLMKLDATGAVTWVKTYGQGGDDQGWCVRELAAHDGFIVAGRSNSYNPLGDQDAYLMKTTTLGTPVWAKVFRGVEADYFYSCTELTNGDIVASGATHSFTTAGNADIFVVKVNFAGTSLFVNRYGWAGDEGTRCVRQISNGNLVLAGNTTSFGNSSEGLLLELTTAGAVVGSQVIGGTLANGDGAVGWDELMDLRETPHQTLIAAGFLFNPGNGFGNYDMFAIELTTRAVSSATRWSKVYGGAGADLAWSLDLGTNGSFDPNVSVGPEGIVMAGLTNSFAPTQQAYLVRGTWKDPTILGSSWCNNREPNIRNIFPSTQAQATGFQQLLLSNHCNTVAQRVALQDHFELCFNALLDVRTKEQEPSREFSGNYTPIELHIGLEAFLPAAPADSFGSIVSSVSGAVAERSIGAYPNPLSGGDMLTVEFKRIADVPVTVDITDINGRVVYRSDERSAAGITQLRVDTEGWAEGVYIARIEAGNERHTRRIVVVRQ